MDATNEAAFKGDLPPVETKPIEEEQPEKVAPDDLLRLENWSLKIEKAQRAIADAQRDIDLLSELQRGITVKYRIDPSRDRVQTDGTIVRAS